MNEFAQLHECPPKLIWDATAQTVGRGRTRWVLKWSRAFYPCKSITISEKLGTFVLWTWEFPRTMGRYRWVWCVLTVFDMWLVGRLQHCLYTIIICPFAHVCAKWRQNSKVHKFELHKIVTSQQHEFWQACKVMSRYYEAMSWKSWRKFFIVFFLLLSS